MLAATVTPSMSTDIFDLLGGLMRSVGDELDIDVDNADVDYGDATGTNTATLGYAPDDYGYGGYDAADYGYDDYDTVSGTTPVQEPLSVEYADDVPASEEYGYEVDASDQTAMTDQTALGSPDSSAVLDSEGTADVETGPDTVAPVETEWVYDDTYGTYVDPGTEVGYDPATGIYYDTVTGEGYDPASGMLYHPSIGWNYDYDGDGYPDPLTTGDVTASGYETAEWTDETPVYEYDTQGVGADTMAYTSGDDWGYDTAEYEYDSETVAADSQYVANWVQDPSTGMFVDASTGHVFNPATGLSYEPSSGTFYDPTNGVVHGYYDASTGWLTHSSGLMQNLTTGQYYDPSTGTTYPAAGTVDPIAGQYTDNSQITIGGVDMGPAIGNVSYDPSTNVFTDLSTGGRFMLHPTTGQVVDAVTGQPIPPATMTIGGYTGVTGGGGSLANTIVGMSGLAGAMNGGMAPAPVASPYPDYYTTPVTVSPGSPVPGLTQDDLDQNTIRTQQGLGNPAY